MPKDPVEAALARRLGSLSATQITALATAYQDGVMRHAEARTNGSGPVPTTLGSERGELLAYVSRSLGRLLTEDEVSALLRIPPTTARSLRKQMLAVYDDLPDLGLQSAFVGAKRDGRADQGEISNGWRVKFSTAEKMDIARVELDRLGLMWEVMQASGSQHILLLDEKFPIDKWLPKS